MSRVNGFSKKYILNCIKQDNIAKIFNMEDVLYNIILKCDLKTIRKLRFVNKNTYKVSKNQHLWKEKTKDIRLKSNSYYYEYKNFYLANCNAKTLDQIISLLKTHGELYFNRLFVCGGKGFSINLTNYNFYWLNVNLKNKYMPMIGIIVVNDLNEFKYSITIDEEINNQRFTFYKKNINQDELIDFFTLLFYHYPDIIIKTNCGHYHLYPIKNINSRILLFLKSKKMII